MLKLSALFLFCFLCLQSLYSQERLSVQFNGGLIAPVNSSTGYSGTFQLNYPIKASTRLYLYSGYSYWDKYYVNLRKESYRNSEKQNLKSHEGINHRLIPVNLGISGDVHRNSLFTSFINFELGYSYLRFTSYSNWIAVKEEDVFEDSIVVAYYPDESTKRNNKEHFFGIGLGGGISREITENIQLVLSFKLNTLINSSTNGVLSAKGTYFNALAGINFTL